MTKSTNPIVSFIIVLFAGLVAVAELVHSGQQKAGDLKRQWVIDQLGAILALPAPAIPGAPAWLLPGLLAALRWTLPLVGAPAINWLVGKLNASSFFVSIEGCLDAVLGSFVAGLTSTQEHPSIP